MLRPPQIPGAAVATLEVAVDRERLKADIAAAGKGMSTYVAVANAAGVAAEGNPTHPNVDLRLDVEVSGLLYS